MSQFWSGILIFHFSLEPQCLGLESQCLILGLDLEPQCLSFEPQCLGLATIVSCLLTGKHYTHYKNSFIGLYVIKKYVITI